MKKIIFVLPLIAFVHNPAIAVLALRCSCEDGTSVATGEYCPGSTVACGETGGGGTKFPGIGGSCPFDCPRESWTASFLDNYELRCAGTTLKFCEYRCKKGYYGVAKGVNNDCTACPDSGTSEAGALDITDCYKNNGSDVSGTYEYTSACYYSK